MTVTPPPDRSRASDPTVDPGDPASSSAIDLCSRWYPPAPDRYERDRLLRNPKLSQPFLEVPERVVPPPSGIGISCSGGGIRSAAYNLGALQALSELGVLARADYLSAVSGGAYIASAFANVTRNTAPQLLAAMPAFAAGSPEEAFVRNRCSYLADGMTGKLRLVVNVLLGILANFVFLALLTYTVGRPLGWFYGWWQPGLRLAGCVGTGCFAHPQLHDAKIFELVAGVVAGLGLAIAVLYRMFQPHWGWRNFILSLATGLVSIGGAIAIFFWLLPELLIGVRAILGGTGSIAPLGHVANQSTGSAASKGQSNLALISGGGVAGTIAVTLNEIRQHFNNVRSLEADVAKANKWYRSLSAGLRRLLVDVTGYLVGPILLLVGFLFVMNGAATRQRPAISEVLVWAAVAVAMFVVVQYSDLTSWSMHPFYKRRLASAFCLKRTVGPDQEPVAVELDYGRPLPITEYAREKMHAPFPELIVCAAANISDPDVTPPGVRVDSFVFSPTCIGGAAIGGLSAEAYFTAVRGRRQRDVTLPAAVAMSGAAVSPAMGKMTRGSLRFLMALCNVRLGVWMPNPRRLPKGTKWIPANPRPRFLINEIVGRHRINSHYIYVTDGGHYENLGLVELLRRKCTTIICLDASGGEIDRYATLGQAMAIARTELNVDITIPLDELRPMTGGLVPKNHALGAIHYHDGTKGQLVYVKAAVVESDPWDVRAYGESYPHFPGDPTLEQLYTGPRFEAYRSLGACSARSAVADLVPDLIPALPVDLREKTSV